MHKIKTRLPKLFLGVFFIFGFVFGGVLQAAVQNKRESNHFIPLLEKNDILAIRKSVKEKTEAGLKSLIELAFSLEESMELRWKALVVAGGILEGEEKKNLINRAVKSPEWFMRAAVLEFASDLENQEALKIAERLIGDKALMVRHSAEIFLKKQNSFLARKILWQSLKVEEGAELCLYLCENRLSYLVEASDKNDLQFLARIIKGPYAASHQEAVIKKLEKLHALKFGDNRTRLSEKKEYWVKILK